MANVTILGNLGANAEAKQLDTNGRTVINFSIAENQRRKNQQGEMVNIPAWYSVSFFTSSVNILPYLKKGVRVMIIGELSFDEYVSTTTGQIKRDNKVVVQTLKIIDFEEPQTQGPQAQEQAHTKTKIQKEAVSVGLPY